MQYKRILEIVKYSSELYREGLVKKGDAVSMRTVDGILISDPEKALEEIAAEDVLKIKDGQETSGIALLHREIYNARPEINAIVTNHAQYSLALSEMVKKFPAVLDDFAQIVGPSGKVSPSDKPVDVIKTLKGRNACLVKGAGALSLGRTLDEAHTGALVLEKGAKAFMEATVLGGAKKIGLVDGLLMNFVYKKKYSKADQELKMEELDQ
jgi:Ribulose-5-phosphate 4-epimerase and related epimerases and aldolases